MQSRDKTICSFWNRHSRLSLCFALLASVTVAGCTESTTNRNTRAFVETQFRDKDGVEHTYLVFLPYDFEPGQKRPLILFLNGKGENGVDGYWTIHNNFGVEIWEMKRHFPFVCAIPQCPDDAGWTGANLQRALDFADQVEKKYGTDEDRLYITGISQGGQGVWHAISRSPNRFAAAAPLCGAPHVDAKKLAASGLPIWNFYNNGDAEKLVEANRQTRLDLMKAGASPLSTEFKAAGHNCWDRAYRSKSLYQWLLANERGVSRGKGAPSRLLSSEEIIGNWRSTNQITWQETDEEFSAPSDVDALKDEFLVSDVAYEDFDLHVDAKFGLACTQCRLALITQIEDSDAEPLQGIEVALPLADEGIGGVRSMDGEWLTYLDPIAQRQLQPNYANDIRLAVRDGRLSIHINGSLAVDELLLGQHRTQPAKYFPAIAANPDLTWQYLRIHVIK